MGLGAVWLGEILKNREKVKEVLEVSEDLELMAVLALGHPTEKSLRSAGEDGERRRDRLQDKVLFRK